MMPDPWLLRWLPLILQRAGDHPILEVGCGSGLDTETLIASGLDVLAFDKSADAVASAKQRAPNAKLTCQDIREAFPEEGAGLGVVVASLSLHYFDWDETVSFVSRIRQTLGPQGLLLCRLNSTQDHHYGASGHPEIDTNYFLVDGEPKRFFDDASIKELFANGWRVLSQEHHISQKYALPKALWEIVLEKKDGAAW